MSLKKVETLPDLMESVLPARYGDSIECDELWTFVGSKETPHWLWLAISHQTSQSLSFSLGKRDLKTARKMWEAIPSSYGRKQVYTDEYGVYANLIPFSRHWVCPKGSGDTNIVEGVNNAFRHRVSYLVRKSSSFARNILWLLRRLLFFSWQHNERMAQRLRNEIKNHLATTEGMT